MAEPSFPPTFEARRAQMFPVLTGEEIARMREVAPTWLLRLPWLSTAEEREDLRRDLAGVKEGRTIRG